MRIVARMPGTTAVALVAIGCLMTGCTEDPAPDPGRPAPTDVAAPDDGELGAALPGPDDLGGIGGYSSCRAAEELCASAGGPDETLSWAKAVEGSRGETGARWAELSVRRYADRSLLRVDLDVAVGSCPDGAFSVPADPRGMRPRPPSEGTSSAAPVELAGFTGIRCTVEVEQPDGGRHEEHWIAATRDVVRLDAAASSEELVLELFEEYVDRLDDAS